jgi:predicted NACHT family NTPase
MSFFLGHKLLITGELGSRKTITLIELAYFLIAQAKQDKDKAILVLFKLSHWKGLSMSFLEWLVVELDDKYKVPIYLGHQLIQEQKVT